MDGHKKLLNLKVSNLMTLLSCMLFFSCNPDDSSWVDNPTLMSNQICFGISPESATISTRNGIGLQVVHHEYSVLHTKESDDTLCVHTLVSEGMQESLPENQKAITRGTPITNQNFYDTFHVLAYWKKNGTLVNQFYMDEDVMRKANNLWSTQQTYYWPGATSTLQFYAWAPTDAAFQSTPSEPTNTSLSYTVPSEAIDQKDLVVAKPAETPGDFNAAQPLTFQHICTAVRFVVGKEMQPGTIQHVSIRNIHHSGTFDLSTAQWTLNNTRADFKQDLNKITTGTEGTGTAITSTEGTFLLLPQTLPADAAIEVLFKDQTTGQLRTLTASIGNKKWEMGTTVTYRLSISPDYELDFTSQPETQDAHYVIYPITIRANHLPEGGWTLSSDDPDNVTFVENFNNKDIQQLVDAGYWLDGYNGQPTLTSSTSGDVKVYVFLKENPSDKDRTITLSLQPAKGNNPAQKFTFTQYCPAWNNGIGVERIQDQDYPWGFSWDSNMKLTYNFGKGLFVPLVSLYINWFLRYDYVSSNLGGWFSDLKITIDFSKVGNLTTATDRNDGKKNTWELYTFNGVNEASAFMAQLEAWGGKLEGAGLPQNPSEFAARACAMKNKYRVETKTDAGNTVYRPVLDQANMVWYLPSVDEAPLMKDNLSGDYWTSTAITNPGNSAYKMTVGSSAQEENRNTILHVRAVRKHP